MATVQEIYNTAPGKGFPGMAANMEPGNRVSRTVEDAAGLAFGAAAFRGAADRGVTGTAVAGKGLGFVIADHGQPLLPGGTADTIPRYDSAAIAVGGAVLVTVGDDVTAGDDVTVGTGAGAGDGISAAAADATHIAMDGWVFDQTVTSGGLAVVVRR